MKCPYCAEEIQDAAILCRFCGATKAGNGWKPPLPQAPPPMPLTLRAAPARKGAFTIRAAAACFLASAFFEILSPTSRIPLFGALRGGAVAAGYHVIYFALFMAMGIGLWQARAWGYRMMFAGTIVYTLDKAIYLLDHHARALEITRQMSELGLDELMDASTTKTIINSMNLLTLLMVACWWGFMFYLNRRRSYFDALPPAH